MPCAPKKQGIRLKKKALSKTTSFLSESVELKGDLFVKGGIRIDGKFRGTLHTESTVYVGECAEIQADIACNSLLSSGNVKGTICAEDTVKLNRPGSMDGKIQTSTLQIEKEVYFCGKCQLLGPKNYVKPKYISPKTPRKAIPNRP